MLYLSLAGVRTSLPLGATAQVVHKSPLFTDGLEDSFSLPFEVPTRGNEITLQHTHQLPLRNRVVQWENSMLGHAGLPLHPGTAHLLSTTPHAARITFSLEGFVQRVKGVMLPDTLREELIDLTDELVNQSISLHLRPLYADGGKCQFPMYRNTELYGDANADWYPSASEWSDDQAYDVNDLVTYTETSTAIMRTDIWQCQVGGASAGESPETHPAKWRRTSFGIVNAWDRANNQHYYNTISGNFYTHVPWFYLKWVLARSLAHIGYTPVGEFMDDTRTHELVLANNTTIDKPRLTNEDNYFDVLHSGTTAWNSDPDEPTVLEADTETPLPQQDTNDLWDDSASTFTPNQSGVWGFVITTRFVNPPNVGDARMYLYDPVAGYDIPPPNAPPIDLFDPLMVTYSPIGTDGLVTFEFSVNILPTMVGNPLQFRPAVRLGNIITGLGEWPNSPGHAFTDTRIIGWQQVAGTAVATLDTFIQPHRHVPNVEISAFLTAIADAFNLTLEPDTATRTLRLDYKEQELAQLVQRTTEHSPRLVNDVEMDHQRAVPGVRLQWEMDDLVDAQEYDADVRMAYSEADLSAPLTSGWRMVLLATRAAFKSVLDPSTGNFQWKRQGYLVPPKLVGRADGATDLKPAAKPVHMVQDELEEKEYLMPELPGLGTSAWFHTEGDRNAIRICEFQKARSSDSTVSNVPSARSWGYGWDGADRSAQTLLWDQDHENLPGLYQRHWERWLAMLTTAEPVTMDLLVDPAFLVGSDWKHPLRLHNQLYLVQELPVEYGVHDGRLMSEGAYLLKLVPGAAAAPLVFRCEGPQYLSLYATEALNLFAHTSTGYLAVRESDGTITVHGAGDPDEAVSVESGPLGQLCLWPCDAEGALSGEALTLQMASNSQNAVYRWWESLLQLGPLLFYEELDIRGMADLEYLGVVGDSCTRIRMGVHPVLSYLSAPTQAITNTDEIINTLNAAIAGGYVDLSGGTSAARTSASDTNYNALVANGWTVITN